MQNRCIESIHRKNRSIRYVTANAALPRPSLMLAAVFRRGVREVSVGSNNDGVIGHGECGEMGGLD